MSMTTSALNASLTDLGIITGGPVPDLFVVNNKEAFSAGYIILSAMLILLMQLGWVSKCDRHEIHLFLQPWRPVYDV